MRCVVHPGALHGERHASVPSRNRRSIFVARPEPVNGHVRMARAPIRVLGHEGERAGDDDLRTVMLPVVSGMALDVGWL